MKAAACDGIFPCVGTSPLGTACKKGLPALVQLLLAHDAAVDANALVHSQALSGEVLASKRCVACSDMLSVVC